jgi:hypothetical protein
MSIEKNETLILNNQRLRKFGLIGLALFAILILIQLRTLNKENEIQGVKKLISNINTPYKVDKHTYLESINVASEKNIDLYFVLTDTVQSIFHNEDHENSIFSQLINRIKKDTNFNTILKMKMSKTFSIGDKNGNRLLQRTIQ